MTQAFNDNLYLIDLSYLNTPAEVVYDLSTILDNDLAKNQKVKLKLGKVDFNKSQLLSLKSLIESINSSLAIVEGESEITRNSAISAGLVYQNAVDKVQEPMFFNGENSETKENTYHEVEPELFPEVNPVKQETSENTEQETNQDQNQENHQEFFPSVISSGETYEIEPQKFETTEENLNFEEDKKEWLHTEEEPKIQNLENEFSNNNWANPVNNQNVQEANERQNIEEKVDSLFENTETEQKTENVQNSENQQPENQYFENLEEQKENNEEETTEEPAPGIQALSDIPLDIPNDKTIQEELDVIYSAERKLDDLFSATGLKEEKFQSIKEIPKAEEKEYTQYDFELEAFPTKYLKQTICTGQYISFEGNLVIIGDCHEGSEISAAGDVTVWGELSGSVHAGKNGNEKCRIRALKMNASQLRISNCYIKRPSVLNDASKIEAVPEEAMIVNGEISVFKIYK